VLSASASPQLRLRTFGGLAIEREGNAVSGAGAQRRPLALLAQLAAAGDRGISRAKLVGLLWPDSDEEKARRVLAQTLYSLRRDLGAEELVVGTNDLRLNAEVVATDVGEFGALVEQGELSAAAALYEGPFLDGFYLPGAPEFERWAEETRASLAHRYAGLVERLADEASKKGTSADEVAWCRKLAAVDPLSAKHAMRLMEALARAGDRAGALQHARVHEALMRAELDVGPDASVVALAERIRTEADGGKAKAGSGARAGAPPETKIAPPSTPIVTKVTPGAPLRYLHDPAISGEFGATQEWMLRLAGGRFDPRISGNPPLKRAPGDTQSLGPDAASRAAHLAASLTPIEPIPVPKPPATARGDTARHRDAAAIKAMPPGTSGARPYADSAARPDRWRWIIALLAVLALAAVAIWKLRS